MPSTARKKCATGEQKVPIRLPMYDTGFSHSRASARPALKICGDCTLCCTLYEVADMGKKAGHACAHDKTDGCGIWGLHPDSCQSFKCVWLKHDDLNGLWRPDTAGFVMRFEPEGNSLCVDVDPARPGHWRREPYYAQLKLWSEGIRRGDSRVLVYAPEGLYVVTPDEDLHLRLPRRGERLETGMEHTLFGFTPYARLIPAAQARQLRRA